MPGKCFVLMPFKPPFDDYYKEILARAIKEAGFTSLRADEIYGPTPIIDDIFREIREAQVLIADVTGRNANVNYELGVAHAMNRPVVIISQTIDDIPFDYRHIRTVIYQTHEVGWERKLRTNIVRSLKEIKREDGHCLSQTLEADGLFFPPIEELVRLIANSNNIDLMIAGGDSFYPRLYEALQYKKGKSPAEFKATNLRVLLRRSSMASRRSAQQFESLSKALGGSVLVRWYDWDFMLRGCCFDHSTAYISYFLREREEAVDCLAGRYNPMTKLSRGKSGMDDFFLDVFNKTFDAFFKRDDAVSSEGTVEFFKEP